MAVAVIHEPGNIGVLARKSERTTNRGVTCGPKRFTKRTVFKSRNQTTIGHVEEGSHVPRDISSQVECACACSYLQPPTGTGIVAFDPNWHGRANMIQQTLVVRPPSKGAQCRV